MSINDRVRVVYRMLHDRGCDTGGGVSGLPPSLLRMLTGLPPSVLNVRYATAADADHTFTSASLMGWYVHVDNLLQWLRHSPDAHDLLSRGAKVTFKRHSDELMLRAMNHMSTLLAESRAASLYPEAGLWAGVREVKLWALGAFCTFATLLGIPVSQHVGWFDLFVTHLNAIADAKDEFMPDNSRDGYGATDIDAEYSEARLRLAFPALWSADRRAYEDTSRRLWELALLLAHTLRYLDGDSNVETLKTTRRFPFLHPLSALLPKVLRDLRVFASFLAIHHERVAPSLVWGLSIPCIITPETALCQLLLAQRRRDATSLLELMNDVGASHVLCLCFRNVPPRGMFTWLNTLPDDWRAQTICVGLVTGPHGGTSLDSLVVLPRPRAPFVGLPMLLHALCLSPEGERALHWMPQNVQWGSALRSVWGWVLATSCTPVEAAWVGRLVCRFLAHPWLTDATASSPVLWPLFCVTQRWLAHPDTNTRVMADWARLALQTGAAVRLRLTQPVRRVLSMLLDDRTTVECARAAGMALDKLADLVQRVRRASGPDVMCTAEESWALAQVLLLQPAITPDLLREVHDSVIWPEDQVRRRHRVDTNPRLDSSTRSFEATTRSDTQVATGAFALMGVLHVRSSLLERFPIRNHAEFIIAVGATLMWMERDMRHPSWSWQRCQSTAARDWETRQWTPYAVHSSDGFRHVQEAWLDQEWVVPQSAHDSSVTTELFHDIIAHQPVGRFRKLANAMVSLPPLSLLHEEDTAPGDEQEDVARPIPIPTRKRAGFRMDPVWNTQTVPTMRRRPSDPPPPRVPFNASPPPPFDWDTAGSMEDLLAATESVVRSVNAASPPKPASPVAVPTPTVTSAPPSLSSADIENLLQRCEALNWEAPTVRRPAEETDADAIRRLLSTNLPSGFIDGAVDYCKGSPAMAPLLEELTRVWRDPNATGRVRELVKRISDGIIDVSFEEDEIGS